MLGRSGDAATAEGRGHLPPRVDGNHHVGADGGISVQAN